MFLTDGPEKYSAPPVDTWMIPSEPASAKPLRAALRVWEDETLMAGNANPFFLASSSIWAYFSGVAMGIWDSSAGVLGASHPSGSAPRDRGAFVPPGRYRRRGEHRDAADR